MAVIMEMTPVWLSVDDKRLVPDLQEAREKLDTSQGETVLDFSSVRRVDASVLRAMEDLVCEADRKGAKVVLCGVSVGVYKVLKLARLASRFSFTN
jgi:anti-anti-sigma regulatory factor